MSSPRHHLNSNSTAQLYVCTPLLARPAAGPASWRVVCGPSHGHCRAAVVADNSAGQAVVRPLAVLTIATGDGSGYTASVVI